MLRPRILPLALALTIELALGTAFGLPILASCYVEWERLWFNIFVVIVAIGVFWIGVATVLSFLTWMPAGSARWKREVLARIGIQEDRASAFFLALRLSRWPGAVPSWLNPLEVGLVARGEGIAFLGEDGSRVAVPATTVVSTRIVSFTAHVWPPRRLLAISMVEGESFLCIIEHPDRASNEAELDGIRRLLDPARARPASA